MAKDGIDALESSAGIARRASFEANTLLETRRSLLFAADPTSQDCF
jgi:hypothetical protein